MPSRTQKKVKNKAKKRIRDPSFRAYLDELKDAVRVQDETDKDFVDQANKFYHHRNSNIGHGDPVVGDAVRDFSDLPKIPLRHMEEFAFRYAMEPRPMTYWAKEFGVNRHTILAWLRRKDVVRYIQALKRYRYLAFAKKRVEIEEAVYDLVMKLIKHPLTDENFESKRKLAMELISFEPNVKRTIAGQIVGPGRRQEPPKSLPRSVGSSILNDDQIQKEMDDIEEAISLEE